MQIETFLLKFFNTIDSWEEFRIVVRDFVITLKEYHPNTPELYQEERDVNFLLFA